MTSDINDIFDRMDRIFGGDTSTSYMRKPAFSPNNYERLIDEDNIYYTIVLRQFNKEDINVEYLKRIDTVNLNGSLKVSTNEELYSPYIMKLPYPIKDEQMKVTFINGILDIICPIDKEKVNKVEIQ